MNNTKIYKVRARDYNRSFEKQEVNGLKPLSLMQWCLMAIVLSVLGGITPMLAQNNNTIPLSYVEKTGADNPFDTMLTTIFQTYFADIDMDGDQDMVASKLAGSHPDYYYTFSYYKNIGSATMPVFELQVNSTMLDSIDKHARGLTFVDIDGDGDQDLFASEYTVRSRDTVSSLYYYKNISQDPTTPNFQLQTAGNNPLQAVVDYYNQWTWVYPPTFYLSFMDVDNDNDQDCFIGIGYLSDTTIGRVEYYRNDGTVNTPNFQLQTGANNPLNSVRSVLQAGQHFGTQMFLFDGDSLRDGDIDIQMIIQAPNIATQTYYFKNIGVQGAPNYVLSTTTPVDSIISKYFFYHDDCLAAVDLDNDGRTEMLYRRGSIGRLRYFVDTVSYLNHLIQRGAKTLNSYPNPSTGFIQLNQVLTGQLRVCNTLGQEVYSRVLNEAKQLDLSALSNGVYILHIRTKEEDYVQQVMIIRK